MSVKRLTRDYSQETKNVKIAMNKSLLKEFYKDDERVVYLNDGDEFQIQIFNDQNTEIGAKITVNGEMIGNAYLVIRPGERVWLDRYLNVARKLKFVTYEVNGNNEQVQKAIQNNGIVKVELFRKKAQTYDWHNVYVYPSIQEPTPWTPNIYYCGDSIADNSCTPVNATVNYCSTLDLSDSLNFGSSSCTAASTATSAATSTATSGFFKCSDSTDAGEKPRSRSRSLNKVSNKTETGRIQEGGYSDQDFEYVNMSFESWSFHTEQIHILPKSVKPVYSNELQKTYCYNCGRKLKSKFNFCPFCGAKL